jgi:uncharacterized protein (TIGR03545 family)
MKKIGENKNNGEKKSEQAESAESKKIAKRQKKEKKKKLFPAKKLPGLLKKKYTPKKIEGKIYRKIYIPSDLDLVKSLFETYPKDAKKIYVPRDKMIEKKEFRRLKMICRDIKRQKATFKLIPFAAVVALIFAAVTVVVAFKNIIVKKGLVAAMQAAFGAKTEIASVRVEILGSSITINGLQQESKSDPMKNIFQTDKIEIDFNLTEALRGKFDAENLEVSGLEVNTARTTSGELPAKKKKEKKQTESTQSNFSIDITQKKNDALEAAKNSVQEIFADYNPQTIISDVQENLKSPEVAKLAQEEAESLIEKWKEKPSEVETQVTGLKEKVDAVLDTDWGSIKDSAGEKDIKAAIEKLNEGISAINSAVDETKSVSSDVKKIASDVKADSKKIANLSEQIKDAVASDNALVNEQLKKIKSFKMPSKEKFLGNTLDSVFYSLIGEYYPYVKQAAQYALEAKANSDAKKSTASTTKKTKTKRETHARLKGTDVYWKADRVPKFLIENIKFSGLNLDAKATDISSDMDKRGKPAVATGTYAASKRTHRANLTVDTRSETENELVQADYEGDNYPFGFSTSYLSMDSATVLKASGKISSEGQITLGVDMNFADLKLSADDFEPKFAYNLYMQALSYIDSLYMNAKIIINGEQKIDLDVDSDLDKKFIAAIKKVAETQISSLIEEAKKEIAQILSEKTNGISDQIAQFVNIENGISAQSVNVDKMKTLLDEKKAELQKLVKEKTEELAKSAATEAVEKIKEQTGIEIPENVSVPSTSTELIDQGKSSLKNLLKK